MGTRARRSGWVRLLRVALGGMALAHLAEAVLLRRRLGQTQVLPADERGVDAGSSTGARADADLADQLAVVAANGVELDDATLRAVASEMSTQGAHVVDLVPGDLPTERALRLLRRVDPDRLTSDRLYAPGGAHEAVVHHPSVWSRLQQGPAASDSPSGPGLDRDRLALATMAAQRYAPATSVLRIAPDLRSGAEGPDDRWREIHGLTTFSRPFLSLAPGTVGLETAHLLAMTAGLLVAPVAAGAALASWCAQPALVFAGRADLRPRDLWSRSALRLPLAWRDNLRTGATGYHQRPASVFPLSAPVAPPPAKELFEARRDTCPWCGSDALTGRIDACNQLQHEPTAFHVDECTACGHVFQNPALSDAGLEHYYGPVYDDFSNETWDAVYGKLGDVYRRRAAAIAAAVAPRTEPKAWLDVGTGHAHFCATARRQWPDTIFDGLDLSDSVEEAERRGWVDTAYRGMFTDLADGLPRSYDVVSMHQYLEHTRDPRREIEAAAKVLEPGGHLMIEVPDPESPWARWLGSYWVPWSQPQHLHLVPCRNLVASLEQASFDIVSVERGQATGSGDLSGAEAVLLGRLTQNPNLPWRSASPAARQAWRLALLILAVPLVAVAFPADQLVNASLKRPGSRGIASSYRVVARKP